MKRSPTYFHRIIVSPIILVIVLFIAPPPVCAVWISGGPIGGDVTCMMKSPSNSAVIYAGTRSGIWKSVDHGETWGKTSFPDTKVLSIVVVPDNQNILYVGTSH